MSQIPLNKLQTRILPIMAVALLIIICAGQYGGGGIVMMLAMTLDLPTIITVAVARYAGRISRVVAAVIFAAFLGELLVAITRTTGDFGSLLIMRLAGQATVALIVRALFKKKRPVEAVLPTANTSSLEPPI